MPSHRHTACRWVNSVCMSFPEGVQLQHPLQTHQVATHLPRPLDRQATLAARPPTSGWMKIHPALPPMPAHVHADRRLAGVSAHACTPGAWCSPAGVAGGVPGPLRNHRPLELGSQSHCSAWAQGPHAGDHCLLDVGGRGGWKHRASWDPHPHLPHLQPPSILPQQEAPPTLQSPRAHWSSAPPPGLTLLLRPSLRETGTPPQPRPRG